MMVFYHWIQIYIKPSFMYLFKFLSVLMSIRLPQLFNLSSFLSVSIFLVASKPICLSYDFPDCLTNYSPTCRASCLVFWWFNCCSAFLPPRNRNMRASFASWPRPIFHKKGAGSFSNHHFSISPDISAIWVKSNL